MSSSHSPSMTPVQRLQRRTGYGLLRDSLQGLDQLFQLGLVCEGDFETIRHDPAGETGNSVGCRLCARYERRVELRRLPALLRLRAGPAGSPLGGSNGHALLDDLPRQCATALVIRHRKDGARMAFAQL